VKVPDARLLVLEDLPNLTDDSISAFVERINEAGAQELKEND